MTTFFISRHPGSKAWATEQGLRIDQHLTHLDTALVQRGDTVIGTLPVHLAAAVCSQGARFSTSAWTCPPTGADANSAPTNCASAMRVWSVLRFERQQLHWPRHCHEPLIDLAI